MSHRVRVAALLAVALVAVLSATALAMHRVLDWQGYGPTAVNAVVGGALGGAASNWWVRRYVR